MFLAVDIGNTSIAFAVMRGHRILVRYEVPTAQQQRKLLAQLKSVCRKIRHRFPSLDQTVICSVVPTALIQLKKAVAAELKIAVCIVGRDIKVPIVNRYRNPNQVGQDRLVCAYAAQRLYGRPLIIIDLGTAITVDVVSVGGEYLGGIIVPGIRLSADTLFQKAALLPLVRIQPAGALIGRDTKESILSGLFHGYGAMLKGLIAQIKSEIKGTPKVIVTGGYTEIMKRFISGSINAVDTDLVFKGIAYSAEIFSQ